MGDVLTPKVKSVENMVKRGWVGKAVFFSLMAGLCIAGCNAKEPAVVNGLTGIVYNYSQDSYASVKVNGKTVGSAIWRVESGDVSGGGGMCCFSLPLGAKEVELEIQSSSGDYKTTAQIEKWWPDLAHYGVVHILPGRKVVIEVRSVYTWPRKDLMEKQLKVLGIKPVVNYTGPMNDGPMERTDGVK